MPRVYVRKFDYAKAKSLHEGGLTYAQIAERVGVSATRVRQVLIPEEGARATARSREHAHNGKCIDCGAQRWQYGRRVGRCVACAQKASATTVREDTLLCTSCRQWKTDGQFPFNRAESTLRRGRHSNCRACLTAAKRVWRERNKVPCVDCGTPTAGKNRNNPELPIRCLTCAIRAGKAK